jgi:hypothetical protein
MKMKFTSLFIMVAFFSLATFAQNLRGQWKGEFQDKSSKFGSWGGNKCEYVLDLEVSGTKVSGFSYTYFTDGPKRYFTICKLKGTLDKKKKYVEVTEFERTKTNVPVEVGNCFQVHKLTYFKKSDGEESLEGNWIPAPKQEGNCGYGISILTRRNLKSIFPNIKTSGTSAAKSVVSPKAPVKQTAPPVTRNNDAISKVKPVVPKPKTTTPATIRKDTGSRASVRIEPATVRPVNPTLPAVTGVKYEKRSNNILKVIEVENESIRIDLYDNGEIDGDSVSLFLNGKLVVARKKLTTKPLSIRIPFEELDDENELVMYADNLGSIPPNTALMIVTDGTKRYEVRITSDLQKSGTIKFVKKK